MWFKILPILSLLVRYPSLLWVHINGKLASHSTYVNLILHICRRHLNIYRYMNRFDKTIELYSNTTLCYFELNVEVFFYSISKVIWFKKSSKIFIFRIHCVSCHIISPSYPIHPSALPHSHLTYIYVYLCVLSGQLNFK